MAESHKKMGREGLKWGLRVANETGSAPQRHRWQYPPTPGVWPSACFTQLAVMTSSFYRTRLISPSVHMSDSAGRCPTLQPRLPRSSLSGAAQGGYTKLVICALLSFTHKHSIAGLIIFFSSCFLFRKKNLHRFEEEISDFWGKMLKNQQKKKEQTKKKNKTGETKKKKELREACQEISVDVGLRLNSVFLHWKIKIYNILWSII